nr:hypothetical protein [Tanacetum cinerariifolium]
MLNNIMAAGSRDRPPMLAPGRYPQWRLRFLRSVDTRPNGEALRKCIISGPYKPTTILVQAVEATDDSPVVPEHTTVNVQFLQQLQPEWSRNANPLALVATAQADRDQYYQTSRSHRSSAPSPKPSIPSKSHTSTRHKGKEIAKPITPPSETASVEDSDPEQAQRDKDMQKNLALIAKYFKKIYKPTNNNLRTSSNSKNKNVDTALRENIGSKVVQQSGIQCFNCKEYRHFAKEYKKPKRVKDFAYHKEKMLLCKQAEQGVPLQAEQYDWLADTDEEVDEQELEAHYIYMAKIQEVPNADSGTNSEPVDQVQNNAGYNVFANNLEHSEQSESIQKQLKKANIVLAQELEECKAILAETSKSMGESIRVRDSFLVAFQTKQTEFEKYKAFNDRTIDYDKLEQSDDERVALANLKLDVDENKKIQKELKKANTTLAEELKECIAILAKTSKSLGESIIVRDSCLIALQNKQTEFEKYKAFNDCTIDYDKLKRK